MQQANWPPELDALSITGAPSNSASNTGYTNASTHNLADTIQKETTSSRHNALPSMATGSSTHGAGRNVVISWLQSLMPSHVSLGKLHHADGSSSGIANSSHGARYQASSGDIGSTAPPLLEEDDVTKGQDPAVMTSAGSAASQQLMIQSAPQHGTVSASWTQETLAALLSHDIVKSLGSVVTFRSVSRPGKKTNKILTVKGLRIRMGVATGWLPAAADIKTSALFDLAKGDGLGSVRLAGLLVRCVLLSDRCPTLLQLSIVTVMIKFKVAADRLSHQTSACLFVARCMHGTWWHFKAECPHQTADANTTHRAASTIPAG